MAPKPTTGDAFEDVLYGSDSDAEDGSDAGGEDEPKRSARGARPVAGRGGPKGKQNKRSDARIRVDNDEPMDLLHDGAANASSKSLWPLGIIGVFIDVLINVFVAADQRKRRQPGKDAARFKTDEGTGRLIIEDEPSADADMAGPAEDDVAGTAYREQMTSVDGFTRGPNGQVKFNKNTKKRRAEEAQDGDVEMADASTLGAAPAEHKKKQRTEPVRLGQEFKAKVRCLIVLTPNVFYHCLTLCTVQQNAGGDVVRRGQQDPYAYLPLSHIGSKKKGGKIKYNIIGKR